MLLEFFCGKNCRKLITFAENLDQFFVDMIKNFVSLLKSKFFWINVVVAIVAALVLMYLAMMLMKVYTHHGESVEVPEFLGLYVNEAESLADKSDLQIEVIDSVFLRDKKPGAIVEQTPKSGLKVKRDRVVYLTINSFSKRQISLPNLLNVSERQATYTLKSLGFEIGNVEVMPSEYADLVLDIKHNGTSLKPGDKVADGAVISLVVGKNDSTYKGEMQIVPLLQGMSRADAVAAIEAQGFIVGFVGSDEKDNANISDPSFKVFRQNPVAGSTVIPGKRIDIWLTKDPKKINSQTQKTSDEDDFFS